MTDVILLWLACVPAARAAEPLLQHTPVFRAGEGGYHTYRIPALVTAPDGSLLAFAEARKDNRGDPGQGDIDLVCRRSTDAGRTWSPAVVVDDPGEPLAGRPPRSRPLEPTASSGNQWAASNPAPVTDRDRRRVWLIYNRWAPGRGTERARPGTMDCQSWARYSDDNGRSWSAAVDITRSAREYEAWGAMFVGPGGAIQTRTGRLVVPAAAKFDTYRIWASVGGFEGRLNTLRTYAIYSDDHGQTWRHGPLLPLFADENQLVELASGDILMDARQGNGDHRWLATSAAGGEAWSPPRPGQAVTPVATSIERYTAAAAGDDRDRIVWTGPAGPGRNRLVIRVSYDEGQTFLNERLIYGGPAAYSDIAILPDKTVGVLWERGEQDPHECLTFTRMNREFLEPPGSVRPVAAPPAKPAPAWR